MLQLHALVLMTDARPAFEMLAVKMHGCESPVLILSVFGNYLMLERSIHKCKLGLHVISAGRHERQGCTCSLTLLLVQGLPRKVCLQLPWVIVVAKGPAA